MSGSRPGIGGVLWPPISANKNIAITDLLAKLEETQWLEPALIAENQMRQLSVLAEHHKAHTPAFAARLKASGVGNLNSLERLRQIEPLSRRDVQDLGERFFAEQVPPEHLPLNTITTSGSTGEPVRIKRTGISRLFWSAFTIRDHLWHERDFSLRMSAIRALLSEHVEMENWGAPVAGLYQTGKAQGIPIRTDITEQLRLLRQFRPELLIIHPNNLDAFVVIWEDAGFDLDTLQHIKTVGEMVRPELRNRVKRVTGLQIEDHYSSQEVGAIAIQCPVSGLYHIMSEALVVEILNERWEPCQAGEIGRVVVSDLHNLATPLIRYDIGDYAEIGPTCNCGRGLPTLKRIWGRDRNLVRLPDGSRYWPLVGYHQYDSVTPVRQYQMIQTAIDEIEFRVVTDEELTPSQEERFVAIIRQALRYPFKVRVLQFRQRLPPGPNGKLEDFVCMVT